MDRVIYNYNNIYLSPPSIPSDIVETDLKSKTRDVKERNLAVLSESCTYRTILFGFGEKSDLNKTQTIHKTKFSEIACCCYELLSYTESCTWQINPSPYRPTNGNKMHRPRRKSLPSRHHDSLSKSIVQTPAAQKMYRVLSPEILPQKAQNKMAYNIDTGRPSSLRTLLTIPAYKVRGGSSVSAAGRLLRLEWRKKERKIRFYIILYCIFVCILQLLFIHNPLNSSHSCLNRTEIVVIVQ